MTAFLHTMKTDHYGLHLGNTANPLNVTKENGNVTIHLGGGHVIGGNRPEDFTMLKDAAEKALALLAAK